MTGIQVRVESDLRQAAVRFGLVAQQEVDRAALRALNRVATTVRAEASRRIRDRYNLKSGAVKEQLQIVRATPNRLESQVIARGKRIALIEFGARQTKRGVTVRITKARKLIRGAFIARMKSGHTGVFVRKGSARLPIAEKFSISLPVAFSQRQIMAALKNTAADRFRVEIAREIKFRTTR